MKAWLSSGRENGEEGMSMRTGVGAESSSCGRRGRRCKGGSQEALRFQAQMLRRAGLPMTRNGESQGRVGTSSSLCAPHRLAHLPATLTVTVPIYFALTSFAFHRSACELRSRNLGKSLQGWDGDSVRDDLEGSEWQRSHLWMWFWGKILC